MTPMYNYNETLIKFDFIVTIPEQPLSITKTHQYLFTNLYAMPLSEMKSKIKMKISEVKRIIESLERLSRNLENLRALSIGYMASLSDKDKAREWSEKIADMASIDSSLPNIFQEARKVTDNEINRLNELIDTTDVNP